MIIKHTKLKDMKNLIKNLRNALYLVLTAGFCVACGQTKYNNYVIDNADKIREYKEGNANVYIIDTCKLNYYQDVTIRMNSDSCYTLVFWGDRDSWLWRFKLDKHFTVDVPYNRYKGENVDKDMSVISAVAACR